MIIFCGEILAISFRLVTSLCMRIDIADLPFYKADGLPNFVISSSKSDHKENFRKSRSNSLLPLR
jgi:hypothetical protein